jgi:hypothetical protein
MGQARPGSFTFVVTSRGAVPLPWMRGTVTEVRHMTHPKKRPDWRRSRSCGNQACVEVARVDDQYLVRDSKNPDAPPLSFTKDEWTTFIQGIEAGDFRF